LELDWKVSPDKVKLDWKVSPDKVEFLKMVESKESKAGVVDRTGIDTTLFLYLN